MLAGPTVPPEMTAEEDVHCPPVEVAGGGSVIQSGGGEGTSSQRDHPRPARA